MCKAAIGSIAALALHVPSANLLLETRWHYQLCLPMCVGAFLLNASAIHEVGAKLSLCQVGDLLDLGDTMCELAAAAISTLALEVVNTHLCLFEIFVAWLGISSSNDLLVQISTDLVDPSLLNRRHWNSFQAGHGCEGTSLGSGVRYRIIVLE